MKVFTKCEKCKSQISFNTWETDRVGLKMNKGYFVRLACKKCAFQGSYSVDDFKAKESKIALLIALFIFVIGTPLILIFLWDKMFSTNNIYTIFGLVIPLLIPSAIFGIISRDDRLRVSSFNRS